MLNDIFRYVVGSACFNRDIFLLENRDAQSRIRDRKCKTCMAFLDCCAAWSRLPACVLVVQEKVLPFAS